MMVTVDFAIKRYKKLYGRILYLTLLIVNSISILICLRSTREYRGMVVGLGFFTSLIIFLILIFILHKKWKKWAFNNVDNLIELKRRMLQDKKFITSRDFNHKVTTEKMINEYLIDNEFIDDPKIPEETNIYYSKSKSSFNVVLMALFVIGGIYLLIQTDKWIIGLVGLLLGVFGIIESLKNKSNSKPQIVISNKGIKSDNLKFYSWDDIKDEYIEKDFDTKNNITNYFLNYTYTDGYVHLNIEDLDIDDETLSNLLFVYRRRFQRDKWK
jgi:uncharacterized membrane protein YiaA